ncbi:MAG: TrbI/VirB10 family protein [Acidobacteriota bacterium]
MTSAQNALPAEGDLRQAQPAPRGVLPKNLKPWLYVCAAFLVILAAVFSGTGKKLGTQKGTASQQAPPPVLQDNTASNQQQLRSDAAAAEQRMPNQDANPEDPPAQGMTPAQQAAAAAYGPNGEPSPCIPGQPCPQGPAGYAQQQLSPAQQEAQQLAARDRELSYDSRFASNVVYTQAPEQSAQKPSSAALANRAVATGPQQNAGSSQTAQIQVGSNLIAPQAPANPPAASPAPATQGQDEHRPEVNIDSAIGTPYVMYEGTTLDTVLMNRLDGDAPGPVKVLVSNPVYSHDRQHVLVPAGTVVLGEAKAIGSPEIGHQRRMALVFHRMIMPDGYSVDLDQFQGLDQSGAEGVKGKVNNHYLQIFGASIALGIVAGAGEIEQGGGIISTSGSQTFATGASSSISQSASDVLDRFIEIPPTITVREGHRVKIYFTQDMLLPAYENHTIPQSF